MNRKPRILVNFFTSQPDKVTGISTYAFQILQALARRQSLELVLLTNWQGAHLPQAVQTADVDIRHAPTPRSEKLQFWHTSYLAAKAAHRLKADVVFTPHPFGAIVGGKARVLVVHDLYREIHPEFYRWDRRLTWKVGFGAAIAQSTRIICVSDTTRHDFARLHPAHAGKTLTIHEASAVRTDSVSAGAPLEGPYALVVANATPNKNLERLIAALALLKAEGLSPRVYWVGRDDTGVIAPALAAHPSVTNFISLGSVDDAALATLYAHARAYITPSLIEGFCIPILEAQAFGVPVLCSDIPVLKEVGGNGALTFDQRDPASIAAALRRVWEDAALRDRLSHQARANTARFSWDKAAAETEQVFRQCLESPHRAQDESSSRVVSAASRQQT